MPPCRQLRRPGPVVGVVPGKIAVLAEQEQALQAPVGMDAVARVHHQRGRDRQVGQEVHRAIHVRRVGPARVVRRMGNVNVSPQARDGGHVGRLHPLPGG